MALQKALSNATQRFETLEKLSSYLTDGNSVSKFDNYIKRKGN